VKAPAAYPRINLIPAEGRSLSSPIPSFAVPAIFLCPLLIMALLALVQTSELKKHRSTRRALEAQQQELAQKINAMTNQKALLDKRKKQNSAIQQILENKYLWSEHFKEMSMMSPRSVWLNELKAGTDSLGKKEMILSGAGESSQAVSYFFQALEQTSFCRRIMMVSSKRDAATNPALYRFRFKCPLMSEPPHG